MDVRTMLLSSSFLGKGRRHYTYIYTEHMEHKNYKTVPEMIKELTKNDIIFRLRLIWERIKRYVQKSKRSI